jgi:excisionase family DNA binding protein
VTSTGAPARSLLTVAEVAHRLGVHEKTVRRFIHSGVLPAVKIGRRVRVDEAELEAYVYGPPEDAA